MCQFCGHAAEASGTCQRTTPSRRSDGSCGAELPESEHTTFDMSGQITQICDHYGRRRHAQTAAERRLHARAATGVVTFCDQRTGSGMRGAVGMADVRDAVPGARQAGSAPFIPNLVGRRSVF